MESVLSHTRKQNEDLNHKPILTPDQWIDDYVSGRKGPNPGTSGKSAHQINLEPYDGTSLRWFSWINLFKSIVHDSNSSPDEKIAILERNLVGETRNIVYGLSRRDEAYKQALLCLKQTCGRLDVMRANILNAIDRMNPKNRLTDPADSLRMYLFDLSRIRMTVNIDLVDNIITKLNEME